MIVGQLTPATFTLGAHGCLDDSARRRDGDRQGGVRELKTTISRLSAFARRLL